MLYRVILIVKLMGVVALGGGLVSAFLSSSLEDRRKAVHRVASPALGIVWVTGYVLVELLGTSMMELWVLAALVLSLGMQGALVHSVQKDRRTVGAFLTAAVPLALVLALMVFRPTWAMMRSR